MKENNSNQKTAYSCYFEVQLGVSDYGKSRADHNEICNRQLLIQIEQMDADGLLFSDERSNEELSELIRKKIKKSPRNFVWEHCSSSTANGRMGIMRLVPDSQHDPSSDFWGIFHREHRNRGGFYEWAVPAGAPLDLIKSNKIGLESIREENIPFLDKDQLIHYFKHAILTNNSENFKRILKTAKDICSPTEVQHIIGSNITIGHFSKQTTLLHIAAENGNPLIVNQLIAHTISTPGQLNHDLDTPAHIAAKHSRANILKKLILEGCDLTKRNKDNKTIHDILVERKYAPCLTVYETVRPRGVPNYKVSEIQEDPQDFAQERTKQFRDPTFVYSKPATSSSNPLSKQSISNKSYTFKDVLKTNLGVKKANYFIKQPEAPVKLTHTFTDVIRKQFGENKSAHFINRVPPAKQMCRASLYGSNANFWSEKNKQQLSLYKMQQKALLPEQQSVQKANQRTTQSVPQHTVRTTQPFSSKQAQQKAKPIVQPNVKLSQAPNTKQNPQKVSKSTPQQPSSSIQHEGKSNPHIVKSAQYQPTYFTQRKMVQNSQQKNIQPANQRVQYKAPQQYRAANKQNYQQRINTRSQNPQQNIPRSQQPRVVNQQRTQQLNPSKPISNNPQKQAQAQSIRQVQPHQLRQPHQKTQAQQTGQAQQGKQTQLAKQQAQVAKQQTQAIAKQQAQQAIAKQQAQQVLAKQQAIVKQQAQQAIVKQQAQAAARQAQFKQMSRPMQFYQPKPPAQAQQSKQSAQAAQAKPQPKFQQPRYQPPPRQPQRK